MTWGDRRCLLIMPLRRPAPCRRRRARCLSGLLLRPRLDRRLDSVGLLCVPFRPCLAGFGWIPPPIRRHRLLNY
jgi:hypothetical protein